MEKRRRRFGCQSQFGAWQQSSLTEARRRGRKGIKRKEKKKTVPKNSRVGRSTVTAVTNTQRWQRPKNRKKKRSKGSCKRVR
jgi:hypothetical protein